MHLRSPSPTPGSACVPPSPKAMEGAPRGSVTVAREAHNLKAAGSTPAPATNKNASLWGCLFVYRVGLVESSTLPSRSELLFSNREQSASGRPPPQQSLTYRLFCDIRGLFCIKLAEKNWRRDDVRTNGCAALQEA